MGECVTAGQHCAQVHMHTDTENLLCCCSRVNCASVTGHAWGLLAIRRYYKGELILRVRNFKNYFVIWQLFTGFKNAIWRRILVRKHLNYVWVILKPAGESDSWDSPQLLRFSHKGNSVDREGQSALKYQMAEWEAPHWEISLKSHGLYEIFKLILYLSP